MPLNLTTAQPINESITTLRIDSFAVDIQRKEIHVGYSELNGTGMVLAEKFITIVEPDFTTAISDASATAGGDVYAALKAALYAQIQAATALTGSIV